MSADIPRARKGARERARERAREGARERKEAPPLFFFKVRFFKLLNYQKIITRLGLEPKP